MRGCEKAQDLAWVDMRGKAGVKAGDHATSQIRLLLDILALAQNSGDGNS